MQTYLVKLLRYSVILGTIPVITLGILSYYMAKDDIEAKVKASNHLILQQNQMQVELMLKALERSTMQMARSPFVKRALEEQWTPEHFVEVRELVAALSNMQTSIMINEAYFVNIEHNWVASFNAFKALDQFEDREALEGYAEHANSLFITSSVDEQTVRMVQKIPLLPIKQTPKGLLVIEILKKDMLGLLSEPSELGFHYIIDHNGQDFLGSKASDSQYSGINRQVLANLTEQGEEEGSFRTRINDKAFIVTYQASPYYGLTYVSVASVAEITSETKKIAVVTGIICMTIIFLIFVSAYIGSHRMYKPIRRLLESTRKIGLHTAVEPNHNELSYIEESIRMLSASRSELQQQLQSQVDHVKEFIVLKLFQGQIRSKDFRQRSERYGFPQGWRQLAVMTVQIDTLQNTRYKEHDRDLLLFAINNMAAEMLPAGSRFAPVLLDQFQVTLLADPHETYEEAAGAFHRTAEMIKQQIEHYLQLRISIGISRPFRDISETVHAYGESLAALRGRIGFDCGLIVHYDEIERRGESATAVYSHLKVMEDQMLYYLKTNDEAQLKEEFERYLNEIFGKELFLKEHVFLLLQLISKIIELIQEQGISIGKTLSGEKILKELFKLNTREEMVNWFQERLFEPVTRLLAKQAESQYIHIGSRLLDMIHTGYEQDLSLESCAAELNYHPVYLSRVFKKHVGIPFSDYLTEYRMNAAKSMLEGTQMKIGEIGERLQYKNTSAFIRTFRRSVGMTPGGYRELNQKK